MMTPRGTVRDDDTNEINDGTKTVSSVTSSPSGITKRLHMSHFHRWEAITAVFMPAFVDFMSSPFQIAHNPHAAQCKIHAEKTSNDGLFELLNVISVFVFPDPV